MGEIITSVPLKKLEVQNSSDDTCVTFILNGEDHTLGNALRYMVMKNPEVKFCGYAIPHPSENKVNLRIQTASEPAVQILRKGLDTLHETCEYILSTFISAVDKYKNVTNEDMDTQ